MEYPQRSRTAWIQEKDGKAVVIPSTDTAGAVRKRCIQGQSSQYLLRNEIRKVIYVGKKVKSKYTYRVMDDGPDIACLIPDIDHQPAH